MLRYEDVLGAIDTASNETGDDNNACGCNPDTHIEWRHLHFLNTPHSKSLRDNGEFITITPSQCHHTPGHRYCLRCSNSSIDNIDDHAGS